MHIFLNLLQTIANSTSLYYFQRIFMCKKIAEIYQEKLHLSHLGSLYVDLSDTKTVLILGVFKITLLTGCSRTNQFCGNPDMLNVLSHLVLIGLE